MSTLASKEIRLASRPQGTPAADNFEVAETQVAAPGEGEVRVRNLWMSVDPYMRARMIDDPKHYISAFQIGKALEGGAVGVVVDSSDPNFAPGDHVQSMMGWREIFNAPGSALNKVNTQGLPLHAPLHIAGLTGLTAYYGLLKIGQPREGETVFVSAAAGAVGSIVSQIAKIKGCRVVGVAGAEDKCKHVVGAYGFDACVNYKDADFREQLAKACPDGIDVYFENVGGETFDAVMELVNDFARIPVCGRIAHYNDTAMPEGPDRLPGFMGKVLVKRLLIKGFIQFDYINRQGDFLKDMPAWIRDGKVKYQEDVVEGLENAVSAFQGLLQGKNRGKLLIQVGDDPTKK